MILSLQESLGLSSNLFEPETNNEASHFFETKYNDLCKLGRKQVGNKYQELLHDVYVSILVKEREGEAFNANYFEGTMISVEEYVISKIMACSKNKKYTDNNIKKVIEKKKVVHKSNISINDVIVLKSNTYRMQRKEVIYMECLVGSTVQSDSIERTSTNSPIVAYMNTVSEAANNSVLEAEERMCIRENIETCIDICGIRGINIINIFKSIL